MTPSQDPFCDIHVGDCLHVLRGMPSESVHCCITSPPYWGLRSYCPDLVQLRSDAPEWVANELLSLGITEVGHTSARIV